MASSAFVRGMSSSLCGSSRALGSRQNSSSGGYLALGGYSRAASRLAAHPIPDISEDGTGATDGLFSDEHAEDGLGGAGGDLSPVTPARPSGMCGGDLLGEPLMVRGVWRAAGVCVGGLDAAHLRLVLQLHCQPARGLCHMRLQGGVMPMLRSRTHP